MGRTMNDMGDSDQHQVGIRVMEQKSDGQMVCTGPMQFQPFLVETGQDLRCISCAIGERVDELISATITLYVAEIVMRVDKVPEEAKPVIERSKVLIETMGHEPEIIEGPGFVERDDA